MGFRFGRRFTVAPGIRLNLGMGGLSLSLGGRGRSLNIGPRGTFANIGLPGTGLSYRQRLDPPNRAPRPARSPAPPSPSPSSPSPPPLLGPPPLPASVRISIGANGELIYRDAAGAALAPELEPEVRRRFSTEIRTLLTDRATEVNDWRNARLDVLNGAPRPVPRLAPAAAGGLAPDELERRVRGLEARLGAVAWPRETNFDAHLSPDGGLLKIDVDLPELEDMDASETRADLKALTLVDRPMPGAIRKRLHARHCHGVLLRTAAEAFAQLPEIERLVLSGYTQRARFGGAADVYVLSARINRADWMNLDLTQDGGDPVALMGRFEARRALGGNGSLGEIVPFD